MRKLVLFLHSSLDGFVEGPKGAMDIGFISYDADLENEARNILSTVDTVVWGRRTYEMMYSYWPTVPENPDASSYERNHAKWIEQVEKIVFSTTLDEVKWNNTRLVKENIVEEIQKLKSTSGGDLLILGSPRLAHFLMAHDLIDEYKITVSPVLVGDGLRLFEKGVHPTKLKLISQKTFDSGAMSLDYKVLR
ncbi:dihydrofolate reductase family protein [Lactococcus allomyrinae]|uniref:Dihydrofolate reductase n=1 Tax=Lactococcus allomyrinae TaxID=2419773 RepID=A0A387BL90_9LACT|nr:dihydrofolate reductase family protein [Lactococcus allomyrinae]AYG01817.1 dihydrofolate reductase [Lactococcus allomyrinae]